MNIMRQLELEHMKSSLPDFGVGDTVDVHYLSLIHISEPTRPY